MRVGICINTIVMSDNKENNEEKIVRIPFTINATVSFTIDMTEDLLVTALEGGSNYLYFVDREFPDKPKEEPLVSHIITLISRGEEILIVDSETNEKLGIISITTIQRGTQLLIDGYHDNFGNIVSNNYDADDADTWLQLVVMGSVVFS